MNRHRIVFALSYENHPSIQCGRTSLAAAARFDADRVRGALDHIPETDRFIDDESGEAYLVSRSTLYRLLSAGLFLVHESLLCYPSMSTNLVP